MLCCWTGIKPDISRVSYRRPSPLQIPGCVWSPSHQLHKKTPKTKNHTQSHYKSAAKKTHKTRQCAASHSLSCLLSKSLQKFYSPLTLTVFTAHFVTVIMPHRGSCRAGTSGRPRYPVRTPPCKDTRGKTEQTSLKKWKSETLTEEQNQTCSLLLCLLPWVTVAWAVNR